MTPHIARFPRPAAVWCRLPLALCAAFALLSSSVAAQVSNHDPGTTNRVVEEAAHGPRSTIHASPAWTDLLLEHLAAHPLAEPADVYKFAHQSVFGPAHAVPSRGEARRYLVEELAALPPGPPDEPLLDRLGDDPPLARLNLRPYLASGGDLGALVDAFAATAAEVKGVPREMARRLDAGAAALRALGRDRDADALATLAAAQAAAGYPAVHHTQAYRAAYAPAYRVVSPLLLERMKAIAAHGRVPTAP